VAKRARRTAGGLTISHMHNESRASPSPERVLPLSHYIFVIHAPGAEFVRICIMEEKSPKSEAEMKAPTTKEAAESARHIATELRERTKSMVAEELPDEIARVLTRLKEVTR
jgi:hypothetical protein